MYSTSMIGSATVDCLLDSQDIRPLEDVSSGGFAVVRVSCKACIGITERCM